MTTSRIAHVEIISDEANIPPSFEPWLKITVGDITLEIATGLAQMIGRTAKGARLRYEDRGGK